jgi:hypothetical protein
MTTTKLAQALNLNAKHLGYRLLPKLRDDLGLLQRNGLAWSVVDDLPTALAGAARHLGLDGHAEAVRELHAEQRRAHDQWQKDGRPRSDKAIVKELDAQMEAQVTSEVQELNECLADNVPTVPDPDPTLGYVSDEPLPPIFDPETGEILEAVA